MSYAVDQSMRELGLRMALGAGTASIFRRVISRGLRLTALGVLCGAAAGLRLTALGAVCGAIAGLALTRLFGKLLYHVSPNDPLAFASAGAVMTITSVTACLLPAWRATRTDPARSVAKLILRW